MWRIKLSNMSKINFAIYLLAGTLLVFEILMSKMVNSFFDNKQWIIYAFLFIGMVIIKVIEWKKK